MRTRHPIAGYLAKMKGGGKSPPTISAREILWSCLGATIGIGLCGYISSKYLESHDSTLLIGSFGASAVLVYGAIRSPLAQPRNLVGGHILSALVGVACYQALGNTIWIASALAVSLAIVVMLATGTLHPPGGATALIAVTGGAKIHALGFFYAVVPVAAGTAVLLIVALLVNNLSKNRKYPEYWF